MISLRAVAGPHLYQLERELIDLDVSDSRIEQLKNAVYDAVLQCLIEAGNTVIDDRPGGDRS